MSDDYISVTEISGDEVTQEQVDRLCNRYYWAGNYCTGFAVADGAQEGKKVIDKSKFLRDPSKE